MADRMQKNEGAQIERKIVYKFIRELRAKQKDAAADDYYARGWTDVLDMLKVKIQSGVRLSSKRAGGLGGK